MCVLPPPRRSTKSWLRWRQTEQLLSLVLNRIIVCLSVLFRRVGKMFSPSPRLAVHLEATAVVFQRREASEKKETPSYFPTGLRRILLFVLAME